MRKNYAYSPIKTGARSYYIYSNLKFKSDHDHAA